ncbi:MAG: ribose 5-phosphate isomerase B [Flavobacteriaceae bacterium]|jgi:ribose 5-phosphate isomerase B|nr:ribose 5-phosphate isomerase B [Flavobacteriaceae bacterium]
MFISIGNDHAGTNLKKELKKELISMGYEISDKGTDKTESVDYPDFIHPVAEEVEKGGAKFGIIICGSGNGAAMTANKWKKIRAALCWDKEVVILARKHNDANILSLPARFISLKKAKEMVLAFIETEFEGGRHERRIKKIID